MPIFKNKIETQVLRLQKRFKKKKIQLQILDAVEKMISNKCLRQVSFEIAVM